MFGKLVKFLNYLVGKKSEVSELETKDALLTKTVLDIHRKRTHSSVTTVPLFSLQQIHAIDRENAIASTEKRVQTLNKSKAQLLNKKHLCKNELNQYLPSISGIKAVNISEHSYVAFEGNGRLVALQQVFKPEDNITVEIEEYHFESTSKIIRRINRVRKHNNLI